MHTPESLSALTARQFHALIDGYQPEEISDLMSWLWGVPDVLARGLNYLDRRREFAAAPERETAASVAQ